MNEAAKPPPDPAVFDDDAQVLRIVEILKAVAHPLRLRVVAALAQGPENVNGLAERLDSSQAVVSQQLRILRMSGLVDSTRERGFSIYRLTEPRLLDLLNCMESCAVPR